MGSRACPRRWQAEAIEDGRLEGAERVAFERHRATCSVCAEEYRVLATVRELSEQLSEDRPTEFERRRLRYEILRQADAIVTAAAPARRWGQLGLAAAAVTVLAVSAVWALSPREQPRVARSVLPHANVTFPALTAQAWKHYGAVGEQRGEARVAEDSLGPAAASPPRPRHREPPGPSGASTRGGADTAGRAFAEAFAAFSSGAYALAEERFLRFETEHPGDTRVEDAAFLRAICRQRRGDQAGAAREADEYLRKFPDGFRRREAEAILVGD